MSPSGWALSWLLLLLYLVPVFAVVYLLDAYEREPLSLGLWGVAVGGGGGHLAGRPGQPRLGGGGRPVPRAGCRLPLDGRPDRPVG
jgi:hypothetical protein